jgi:hypothetical protein
LDDGQSSAAPIAMRTYLRRVDERLGTREHRAA